MDISNFIPLSYLPIGIKAVIKKISLDEQTKIRLFYLGFIPDTIIQGLYISPSGDPTAYLIRGTIYALRRDEAEKIWVDLVC